MNAPPRDRAVEDCSANAKVVFDKSKAMQAPNPSAQASTVYAIMVHPCMA
jgi:hypothetical protein